MPIKGIEILKLVLLKLKEAGLKEGDQLDPSLIPKAIKALGYFDDRTISKYRKALLESDYVRKEQEFEELKRISLSHDEILRRGQAEEWSHEKYQSYHKGFMRSLMTEKDWSLIDEKDIIIEKLPKSKAKYFITHFP